MIARGELAEKPAEDMDTHAEVAGVGGGVRGILGQVLPAKDEVLNYDGMSCYL